ncbi:MAG: hypothetical protein HN742_04630 [Lentisphaerae bacterium]|jgi:hypothetical protein|nr:hypothetical protein [Lentisphaerota bacterium]MBT4822878.1 hypothetical protein [Lentisphaerota bacterium]MBT5612646.1 hypothetical protein [Lentisphaerota bacterium]MBT7053670.1 hypothetical protein [Lentisphaerota bacterium]MBT7841131.1 hypothetical protein [Lentisphaerota bacterium]
MEEDIKRLAYLRSLELWFKASEKYLYQPPDRPDLLCYGSGFDSWGVQTQQKALAAYGVAAADPDFDPERAGSSRDELSDRFRKMVRFNLESHATGSCRCLDNHSWGNTWISGLGLERMAHAIEALEGDLASADRDSLRRVLLSESDWLTDDYEIAGDPDGRTGKNRPESNLWNGALLCRTAVKYPDASRAAEYWERGVSFLVNSISVPADAESEEIVDGKTLAERHIGANFFPSFSLDHHSYLNVGYMVTCLSNVAMAHFWFKNRGVKPPEALYLHVAELWRLVKTCLFPDGRFWRIGGDTRVRYCFCQDFLIPALLFVRDYLGDPDATALEAGWLAQVDAEQQTTPDGSYLGGRLAELPHHSPLYYTRMESDRALAASMGAYWRRIYGGFRGCPISDRDLSVLPDWSETFHGACLVRGERRLASRVWRAGGGATANTCVPVSRSDMAEWNGNMSGEIVGLGSWHVAKLGNHREWTFPGGFLTIGDFVVHGGGHMEGQVEEDLARQWQVQCALPDDATVIGLQYAKTLRRAYLKSVKGLRLLVPNDIFNQNHRTYVVGSEEFSLTGPSVREEILQNGTSWLNIDDCLGVVGLYGADQLSILRPGCRNIAINSKVGECVGGLHAEEICYPIHLGVKDYDCGAILYDVGFAVIVGAGPDETANFSWKVLENAPGIGVRALEITGADRKRYLLVANLADQTADVGIALEPGLTAVSLAGGEDFAVDAGGGLTCSCAANTTDLFLLTEAHGIKK